MTAPDLDTPYRGGFVAGENGGREHHFALTVYFEDTDTAGIVYYANYLKFMERARSDMLRCAGIDQKKELDETASAYAVAEVAIKYRKPAVLGDDLVVVSTIEQVRSASVTIYQSVRRGGEDMASAHVTAAFLSRNQRPKRQPRQWVERFRALQMGTDSVSKT